MTTKQAVFGIVGKSGSGKTTLIEAMVAAYVQAGIEVAVIKHSHHRLQFEPPHKDSARFRQAGAREVVVASPYQYAIFHTPAHTHDPGLEPLLARLSPVDIVLVEGYRQLDIPRIEVYRESVSERPLYPQLSGVVALASDSVGIVTSLPVLDLNQPFTIAAYIIQHLQVQGWCLPSMTNAPLG